MKEKFGLCFSTPLFDYMIKGLFFLLVVSVPLFFSFELTTYTLPKIVLTQIIVSILVACWIFRMTYLGEFSFSRSMLFRPILVYFIISVFSLVTAISVPGGLSLLWQIFAYILIYFIVINHVHEEEIETWVLIVNIVGILVSGYGVLQYFGIEPFLKGYHYEPYIPFSTLGHRNQVAQYVILLIPLSGAFFFLSSSWIKKTLFGVGTAMMVYTLFITKSRGGLLGFLFSLLLLIGIGIYKWLGKYSFFYRKKWFFISIPFLFIFITLFFITFPQTVTLRVRHVNPIGYYIHSIDGSKIPPNEAIRVEFDYRAIQGTSQKLGYVNLYGERTNTPPIYLTPGKEGWHRIKKEDLSFSSTPFDEDIKLRWVPESKDCTIQLRNIIVQTKKGTNLIKDSFLNRLFSKLGVTEVNKVLSSQTRLYMYRNTIEMIKHHFFIGAGFGNFKYVYPRYRDRGEWALSGLNTRVEQAHNEYLQIFSEVGLIGFLAFVWILAALLKMSVTTIQRTNFGRHFLINLTLTMGITATLVQSFFDFNLQNPASGISFWMAVGFLEVIYHSVKKDQSSKDHHHFNFSLRSKKYRWLIGIGIFVCLIGGIIASVRPAVGDCYLKRGRLYAMWKDWGRAFFNFEKAGVFSPYHFDVFFHLGQISDILKHHDRSVNYYKRAIDLHPYFIEARNNLGAIYIKLGMIDEAIEEFKESIEINPYHPGLHNNLGYLYGKRNLLKEAIEEYHKTLELDPDNLEVHKNLGILYFYKLRDYPKARIYWERYLVLNPADPQNESIKLRVEEIKKGKLKF